MKVRLLLGLAAALAMLTACGDGGDDGSGVASISSPASTSASAAAGNEEDAARAWAKCMREHGVDVADPKPGGGGIGVTIPEGVDRQKAQEATEACTSLLPNGGAAEEVSPEDLDKQRELAKCLREHGVDVADPTADSPGIQIQGDGPDNGAMAKAMESCQQHAPQGGTTQSNNTEGGQ